MDKKNGCYTKWTFASWLTFWDRETSGSMKEMQKLNIDREMSLGYFSIKKFPKICLLLAVRMYNRTNTSKIDVYGKEAKELKEVFEMFIEDVDNVWLKKKQ